jgi:hypothetical protein
MPFILNKYWLDYLWGVPVAGGADIDDNPLEDLNPDNPADVAHLVANYLRPLFDGRHPLQQMRLKETFRYALNTFSESELEHDLDSILPPFRTPDDIRTFYERIWQAMFGDEPWRIEDFINYVVSDESSVAAMDAFNIDDEGWLISSYWPPKPDPS